MLFDFDTALQDQLRAASTMKEVRDGLIALLARVKAEHPEERILYVIGIISSDGAEHVQRNLDALERNTKLLREHYGPFVFSARSVWSDELFARVGSPNIPEQDFIQLWDEMLHCGCISGLLLTPRWEISRGAQDEHRIARSLNLEIHCPEVLFTSSGTTDLTPEG